MPAGGAVSAPSAAGGAAVAAAGAAPAAAGESDYTSWMMIIAVQNSCTTFILFQYLHFYESYRRVVLFNNS